MWARKGGNGEVEGKSRAERKCDGGTVYDPTVGNEDKVELLSLYLLKLGERGKGRRRA